MAPSSLGNQTADCESPHDWIMSLSMLCVTCEGENGTNGSHFIEDVAFACYFVALRHPPTFPPIGVLVVLATPVKNYLKWQAIQQVYSRHSELP